MEDRATLKALKRGEVVEVDGIRFRPVFEEIKHGDFYVAERNGPPVLLIANKVDKEKGWIFPEGIGYPFNIGECVRVEEV